MAGPTFTEEAGALGQEPQDTDYWAKRMLLQKLAAQGQSQGPSPMPSPMPGMGDVVASPPVPPPPGSPPMADGDEGGGVLSDVLAYLRTLLGGGQR